MHGIMLQRLGHNVCILEQAPDNRESHMAGIGAATDVLHFLEKYDRVDQPLGISSECLQSLDKQGRITPFLQARRVLTSWDALYYRLRANFDGLHSDYCVPHDQFSGTSRARYESEMKVREVIVDDRKVSIKVEDSSTNETKILTADMLIGADGTDSIVRRSFLSRDVAVPRYSGYVAWRGVMPESHVSEKTRKIFQHNVTYFLLQREHVIMCVLGSMRNDSRPLIDD